jgi:hypothetical protein
MYGLEQVHFELRLMYGLYVALLLFGYPWGASCLCRCGSGGS